MSQSESRRFANIVLHTIGHSAQSSDAFLQALVRNSVEWIVDVRSTPASSRAPQFTRDRLQPSLLSVGIGYTFAGQSLGGRPSDPQLYDKGRVSYNRMALNEHFRAALRRLVSTARTHRIALLCAEADPIECHRFLLIGRILHNHAMDVRHILLNGSVELHRAAEMRLVAAVGLAQGRLFRAESDVLTEAYDLQAARVAYMPKPEDLWRLQSQR